MEDLPAQDILQADALAHFKQGPPFAGPPIFDDVVTTTAPDQRNRGSNARNTEQAASSCMRTVRVPPLQALDGGRGSGGGRKGHGKGKDQDG